MRQNLIGLCLTFTLLQTAAASENEFTWPQWRGPSRDATIADRPQWPRDLKNLSQSWRVELGPSYSGPIVSKDRVFTTETRNESHEVVYALDRATGEKIWETEWPGSMSVPFFAKSNGDWIRSTPAFDGESLFVAGMQDVLVCLDAENGGQRWRVDFMERYDTDLPAFGFVSSPMVQGDHVYVQAGAAFVKLDKHTGETVWRTLADDGGMMGSAFSSPMIATIHGVPQIVVQTRQVLAGVNPDSGDVLWQQSVPSFRGMNILTPTVYGNGVLTSTHKNRTFFYRITKGTHGLSVAELWTNKAQGYMSSPVVRGDFAYLHLGNGRLTCIDLRTGNEQWRSEPFGKYWSMVLSGDRILALDQRGELLLIEADPNRFVLLDRRKIAENDTWAHLAVCGKELFVRELKALAAFRWE